MITVFQFSHPINVALPFLKVGMKVNECMNPTFSRPSGFNPMWEETLVFHILMPQIALVRFQVWDHDPIGRDFIGQRTIALSSMMPGESRRLAVKKWSLSVNSKQPSEINEIPLL